MPFEITLIFIIKLYLEISTGYRTMSNRKNDLEGERNSIWAFIESVEKEKKQREGKTPRDPCSQPYGRRVAISTIPAPPTRPDPVSML
jgi:hypothetical protein